jgi:hypothetical protein
MAMTTEINSAIKSFKEIILGGVPILLKQNETAFLSIICTLAAIDALAAYRYTTDIVGIRFADFIIDYFPTNYKLHAANLYKLRCRMLHNFSPAYFSLTHGSPDKHFQKSEIGDTILSDEVFFSDMKTAALKYFNEVEQNADRQNNMNARLLNIDKGGAIFYE